MGRDEPERAKGTAEIIPRGLEHIVPSAPSKWSAFGPRLVRVSIEKGRQLPTITDTRIWPLTCGNTRNRRSGDMRPNGLLIRMSGVRIPPGALKNVVLRVMLDTLASPDRLHGSA